MMQSNQWWIWHSWKQEQCLIYFWPTNIFAEIFGYIASAPFVLNFSQFGVWFWLLFSVIGKIFKNWMKIRSMKNGSCLLELPFFDEFFLGRTVCRKIKWVWRLALNFYDEEFQFSFILIICRLVYSCFKSKNKTPMHFSHTSNCLKRNQKKRPRNQMRQVS